MILSPGTKMDSMLKKLADAVVADATGEKKPCGVPLASGNRAWFEFIDYREKPRMAIAVKNAAGETLFRYISKSFYRMDSLKRVPA